MELIFNELCLNDIPRRKEEGRLLVENFLTTYSKAISSEIGFSRTIKTSFDLNHIEIADGYYVSEWRNHVDRDLARRYSGMCDRQILISDIDDDMEFFCTKGSSIGALFAFINDDFLFSLETDETWKAFIINGTVYSLEDDSRDDVFIYNISNQDQLISKIDEIQSKKIRSLQEYTTGTALSKELETIFPCLIFHENAKKQLEDEVEPQHISAVCKKLFEIDRYFASWDGIRFDPLGFKSKISPQSPETLKRFERQHTFEFGTRSVIASFHLRYTGNIPGRVYFSPDLITNKGLICSLTTKLPTVSDPKI